MLSVGNTKVKGWKAEMETHELDEKWSYDE
jgi:hypothetical protein